MDFLFQASRSLYAQFYENKYLTLFEHTVPRESRSVEKLERRDLNKSRQNDKENRLEAAKWFRSQSEPRLKVN